MASFQDLPPGGKALVKRYAVRENITVQEALDRIHEGSEIQRARHARIPTRRRLIINAAMIPNEGTFNYRVIQADEAREWLLTHGVAATSFVGYHQTAEHIAALSGVQVALNRAKASMGPCDEALVVYRVHDPATKGQPQPEEWEYGLILCVE